MDSDRQGKKTSGDGNGSFICGEENSQEARKKTTTNRTLETLMFTERQTLGNLVQGMTALALGRKERNEIGDAMVGELRHRLWLYGFLLRSQRSELERCIVAECKEHGYNENELHEAMRKNDTGQK